MGRSARIDTLVATHHVQVCSCRVLDEAAKKVLERGLTFSDWAANLLLGSGQSAFFLRKRAIFCDVEWLNTIALAVVASDSTRVRALVLVLRSRLRTLFPCRVNALAFVTKCASACQVVVASFLGLLTGCLLGALPF
jgi:hypothetical protein